MSFLLSRHWCTKAFLVRSLNQQTARKGRTRVLDLDSFEAAGIQPTIAASLRNAFPSVQKPTAMQRKLIRAITENRDVLLQDDTGTGKSFAAILALLSRFLKRKVGPVMGDDDGTGEAPSGLLIVPHRDLAYQYLHWIHHITLPWEDTPSSLMKYAQVLVRHANRSTLRGLPIRMQEAIRSTPSDLDSLIQKAPHILIATPNAALEFMERQSEDFRPATVMVDEVDALLRVPSSKFARASPKKIEKHVPILVQVLDKLCSPSKSRQWVDRHSRQHGHTVPGHRPQLIMISATLRTRLQSALSSTFGWTRHEKVLRLIRKRSSARPCHRLGKSAVHHVLVVSRTGDVKNIVGARASQSDVGCRATPLEDYHDEGDGIFYDTQDDHELVDDVDKGLLLAPLAFDPAMLEAVAATLALDVPRIALLVLPATAAVRKVIFELRQLGVNAHPLDFADNAASRSHVLSGTAPSEEGPVLIVATLATVRGIDLPDLTHVLMLGVPEGRSGDAYLHVAGRVGRFGRRGKVITILEERKEERKGNKVVVTDGPKKMTVLLSRIGVRPSRLEHFD